MFILRGAGRSIGIWAKTAPEEHLLKIMTGATSRPSRQVHVHGRIAALLELGAGFHPELTGRENIFLNGSVYGIGRKEMRRKLDSIIDFAEIGDFIDMPVKHYSSGMYVRLGFSVAIHTAPEVLIVDEVLTVGDQIFQQKCMQRILGDAERWRGDCAGLAQPGGNSSSLRSRHLAARWRDALGSASEVADAYMAYSNARYYAQQLAEATSPSESATQYDYAASHGGGPIRLKSCGSSFAIQKAAKWTVFPRDQHFVCGCTMLHMSRSARLPLAWRSIGRPSAVREGSRLPDGGRTCRWVQPITS